MKPLKRVRLMRGMSQGELAEAAGVSRQVVSNLERGASRGYAETYRKLAEALDVHAEEIMEGGGDSPKVPGPVRSLDVEDRRALLRAIAGKKTPPLPGELKELMNIRRAAVKGGMTTGEFVKWFRRASANEIREELLPEEFVNIEELIEQK